MSHGRRRWRALLLGGSGQLGFELVRSLAPIADVVVAGTPSSRAGSFDVASACAVDALVDDVRPDLLVNASAYTAVDAAETEPERAHAVNARGPAHLGASALRHGAALVHFSTDYVFAGDARGAYREDDATGPLNVYGRTKLEGERAIEASGATHIVLRTGWLFGAHGRNFVAAILAAAGRGRTLRVVDDQVGCPTSARLLAELTGQLLAQALGSAGGTRGARAWLHERQGVYHAVGAGSCSWYELAGAALERAAQRGGPVDLQPVSTAEYGARAPRPMRSVLDCSKLAAVFGLALPAWPEHVAQVLSEGLGKPR